MDKNQAIRIDVDGTVAVVDCPNDDYLRWGREQIGCDWVERVCPQKLPNDMVMMVDEEGLLKDGWKPNLMASYLYGALDHGSVIAGNVVVLREVDGPDGCEFAPLTEEQVNEWRDYFTGKMKVLPLLFTLKFG